MTKKLIYIVGAGRSGTTLLDIMLGNSQSAVSLGEINRFYKRNGLPPKREVSSKTFQFWSKIKSNLTSNNPTDFNSLNKLFRKNEYHSAFFKSLFKINSNTYKACLKQMYVAIKENTDQDILIESSKYPARALNLSNYINTNHIEISYIYLKKDPVSVVSSFQKENLEQPKKSFLEANLYYFIVNLLCMVTIKVLSFRGHKTATIKYDDLILTPEQCIEAVQKRLNINLKELIKKTEVNEPLDTGLLFDGNRIRLEETIVLKNEEKKIKKSFNYYFTKGFNYILYK